jgi:hypothetical protein
MNRDFVEMLSALSAAGADYLIVGAYAMAAHGWPRATGDIDIWVRPTPDNAARVLRALEAYGAPLFDLSADDLTRPDTAVGPTFASLNCRLADLIAAVQAETQLGKLQPKLVKAAQKAKQRKEVAEGKCAEGKTKPAGKQLEKVVRKLIQFAHRLRSKAARKKVAEAVREPLAETADEIQQDARELKDALSCGT